MYYVKKNWRILLIVATLIAVLVVAWYYLSQPHYETLLYGKIKLVRSDDTPSHWFFYEFDISQETELTIKIEQGLCSEELLWYLCNSTKETIENTTNWFSLTYAYGEALTTFDRTILLNKAGNYTFILILPEWSRFETVPVVLELSIKPPSSFT